MPSVLVTGGSGFFGGHLVKELLKDGFMVRVLDIEETGDGVVAKDIEFVKGDIRDRNVTTTACSGMDYVFHNAALLPVSRSNRRNFWDVNVNGTRNVLDASLAAGVKKVVFISSSAPYGIPKELPITERTAFNPVCDYGSSKVEAERVCRGHREKGLDVVILRPRTLIGEYRLGIFQILYSWILDKKNIYIIGRGDNLFQLLSGKDLVAACILAIKKECGNMDFNLGAEIYGTVRQDLQSIIDYRNSASRIISLPAALAKLSLGILDALNLSPFTRWHYLTPDKPFYFDITHAKSVLGWHPMISNVDMLIESFEWYARHRGQADSAVGTTHKKAVKQRVLGFLKRLS